MSFRLSKHHKHYLICSSYRTICFLSSTDCCPNFLHQRDASALVPSTSFYMSTIGVKIWQLERLRHHERCTSRGASLKDL